MATLRKLVSDVRAMHKLLSTDNLLTDRAIASEIRNNTIMLVKRETNLRRLWATDTLFTTIPCLEMKDNVPISECCDYTDPCTVSRSKFRLPRISEGNYQYLIQGVWSINAMGGKGTRYKEITINRYLNLLKLPIIKNNAYYWIVDGYLYVSNPLLQKIRIAAFFEDDLAKVIEFPTCAGVVPNLTDYCMNPLDKEYGLPGYLEKQVLELTSQKLLQTYFKVKQDLTSDGVDGQSQNALPGS